MNFCQPDRRVSTAREMQEWREAWVGFQQHKDAWVQACTQALQQARKPPSCWGEQLRDRHR
jgi:hypothetical protein